ncbi:rCG42209, partial [Rattus norvegicus]
MFRGLRDVTAQQLQKKQPIPRLRVLFLRVPCILMAKINRVAKADVIGQRHRLVSHGEALSMFNT